MFPCPHRALDHFSLTVNPPDISHRRRFRITATLPAKSPPPKIVDPMDKNASNELESGEPCKRSRTPPCTIKTASVNRDPIPNHQMNVRILPHGSTSVAWLFRLTSKKTKGNSICGFPKVSRNRKGFNDSMGSSFYRCFQDFP